MKHTARILGLLTLLLSPATLLADGMIVPIRPDLPVRGSWSVKYHHVDILVRDQAASVTIDQEFVNTGDGMIEVEYLFPVPQGAAIDAMTLIVDGQEMPARLLAADEARRIYEEIVRRKKDPALLEYAGQGLYRTRAFPLEPGKPARVQVHYDYIPHRDYNLVELLYPLNTEKFSAAAIEDVRVRADIEAAAEITSVYSPTHDLTVERKGPRRVVASWSAANVTPTTDFQVFYRTSGQEIAATLVTYRPGEGEDGYFMALLSPNLDRVRENGGQLATARETLAIAKEVVIVLDRSGSMNGEKITQAREAAAFILRHLSAGDRYGVIAYNDGVEVFHKGLQAVEASAVADDVRRVEAINAGGGTNIHDALDAAFKLFTNDAGANKASDDGLTPARYVIFLTDGLPTVGQTDETVIIADAARANAGEARLLAVGVGYDVNVRLLDRLVGDSRGFSEYIKPNENIETKVSRLYTKVQSPVMTDLEIDYPFKIADAYPRKLGDLFAGDQLVVVGRVHQPPPPIILGVPAAMTLTLKGNFLGQQRRFEFPVAVTWPVESRYAFVERIWALRRVGWLLDQVQLHGENKELTDELIALSTRYGIITPYTSFLAEEKVNLADRGELRARGGVSAGRLMERTSGAAGQQAAVMRQQLNRADKAAAAPLAAPEAMAVYGNAVTEDYEAGRAESVVTVRQAGNTAAFRKNEGLWVAANASDVDPETQLDQARRVERFSEGYFELTRANSPEENQLLAAQKADEKLLIRLRGALYLIE